MRKESVDSHVKSGRATMSQKTRARKTSKQCVTSSSFLGDETGTKDDCMQQLNCASCSQSHGGHNRVADFFSTFEFFQNANKHAHGKRQLSWRCLTYPPRKGHPMLSYRSPSTSERSLPSWKTACARWNNTTTTKTLTLSNRYDKPASGHNHNAELLQLFLGGEEPAPFTAIDDPHTRSSSRTRRHQP